MKNSGFCAARPCYGGIAGTVRLTGCGGNRALGNTSVQRWERTG